MDARLRRLENNISSALLAGGKSTRMGQDKAWVRVGNIPLIQHILTAMDKSGLAEVYIIANTPERYASLGLPIYLDNFLDCGALGGIESALSHTQTAWTLVVGCDMPFIRPSIIAQLITHIGDEVDVILPIADDMPQPLCALYHVRCLPTIHKFLADGQYKVRNFLDAMGVVRVSVDDALCFFNVNTPQALIQAETYWKSGQLALS